MNKVLLITSFITCCYGAQAQKKTIQFNVGPEVLRSFNYQQTFWGAGVSVQAEAWVKPALGLGLNTGYMKFFGNGSAAGREYSIIPVLAVIRYPLPVLPGLYGQDVFGYTFANNVIYEKSGQKMTGGITYYFALGYVIHDHIDISAKVGRPRFHKKDDNANVNEHNFGLKVAYRF